MHETNIHNLFELACLSFPNAEIFILDDENSVLHSRLLNFNFLKEPSYTGKKSATTIVGTEATAFHSISIPIFEQYQLCTYIPVLSFPDIFIPARMLDQLVKVYLNLPSTNMETHSVQMQNETQVFFDQLFYISTTNQSTYVSMLSTKLGIDLSLNRLVCIIQFEKPFTQIARFSTLVRTIKSFLKVQKQDIYGLYGSTQIIYCPHINLDSYNRETFEQKLEHCIDELHLEYKLHVRIGIGLFVQDVLDYSQSFLAAITTLQIFAQDLKSPIACVDDYLCEQILHFISQDKLDHFLSASVKILQEHPLVASAIGALVNNDMDLYSAADYLHIHRNTIVFRIQQLKKLLHLNPLHNDSDRLLIHLIYRYYQQLEHSSKG